MFEKNLKTTLKLLSDFGNSINNRSLASLVIFDNNFSKILEWCFRIWKKEYGLLEKEDRLDEWGGYSELSRIFDLILKNIEERSLKEGRAYPFFRSFEKHVEKYKKETEGEGDKKFSYIESLFEIFCTVFFENIETSSERFAVWNHHFPKSWKITKNNLESEENTIARVFLHKFLEWARDRIWQPEEKFDQKLDGVARNLFSETDPMLWAKILIFVLSPYGENRVKSIVEQPWTFGFIGSIKSYSEPIKDGGEEIKIRTVSMTGEIRNTFELLYCLAKIEQIFNIFSKENLRMFIEGLGKLKGSYPEESDEEIKRGQLLSICGKMLGFLEDRDK